MLVYFAFIYLSIALQKSNLGLLIQIFFFIQLDEYLFFIWKDKIIENIDIFNAII